MNGTTRLVIVVRFVACYLMPMKQAAIIVAVAIGCILVAFIGGALTFDALPDRPLPGQHIEIFR